MLNKLREILLTQYIGSILVALLCWQSLVEIVTVAVRSAFWYFNHQHTESVLAGSSGPLFRWDSVIVSGGTVVLYWLTAYGLARWLYPATAPPPAPTPETEPEPSSDQP